MEVLKKIYMKNSIVLILAFLFSIDMALGRKLYFDQYTVDDGLTSNLIHDIEQDGSGHIWVATDFGLSRFDGKFFKQYSRDKYPSLLKDEIFLIKIFPDHSMFVGSQAGVLLKYNPVMDVFEDYSPLDFDTTYLKQIDGFWSLKNNKKLVYTSNGLYYLEEGNTRFSGDFEAFKSFEPYYILSFCEDSKNRYWISSFNTLHVLLPNGQLVKKYDLSQDLESMFSSKIFQVSDNKILITCFSNVLYSIDLYDDGSVSEPVLIKLPFSNLNKIICDQKGRFWYSSDGDGLWCSDECPNTTTKYERIVPSNLPEDCIDKIYDIEEAANGDIWVGTYSSGLLRCSPNRQQSFTFSSDVKFPMKMASSFSEGENQTFYVSCDGGGLARLSSDYSVEKIYNEKYGLTSRNIVGHTQDKDGHLWLATWGGGILEFDPKTEKYRQERFPGLNSNLSCFSSAGKMSNGEIWVCTGGDGMYMKNTNGVWTRYLLQFSENEYDMWPYRVMEGEDNSRWIITSRTLWYVKGNEKRPLMSDFSKWEGHNPMRLNDMTLGNKCVYVSTDRNIIRYSADAQTSDTLTFLPVCDYQSICVNEQGKLLASCTWGLLEIDVEEKTYKRLNYSFEKKGFNFFRPHSRMKTSDGRVFWGTKDGFVVQERNMNEQFDYAENFELTEVNIEEMNAEEREKYVTRGDDGNIKQLELPYNKTAFSVFVDWVDYTSIDVNFSYCLHGLSDKWNEVQDNRVISFSYIPSGSYELEVQAVSGTDTQKRSISIVVLPPWWKSWWFTFLCIVLIVLIVGGVFSIRLRRLKRQREELRSMVEERTKELDQKNVQIEQQNVELKHVLADKDRVLSVVAHDLKNPMFAIVGALEGWMRRESVMDDAEKRDVISRILTSSQTLQSEMGRLLEWARAKSDKIDFNPTNVDLVSLMRNIGSLLFPLLSKKNITLLTDVKLTHCIWGDSRMISTIFRNFINNAIKFTNEGGKIYVTAYEKEGEAYIEIKDTGVGMSKDKLTALRTNGYCDSSVGTDNEQGTGLGFRICRDYIERNKGDLMLDSVEGEGTTIGVTLPLSAQTVSEIVPSVASQDESLKSTLDKEILEGNKVVVVDDDSLICKNISDILSPYMEVHTALNGEEALNVIEEVMPDLILSDVEMPVMNGIELSRKMTQNEQTDSIPFLFLSAKNDQSDRLLGLLSGAIDYIPKPFSESELLMKVNNILRIRQRQQTRLLKEYYQNPEVTVEENVPKEEKLNPFIAKMMEVIEQHYYDSSYSVEQLAEEMGVSQSTMSRRTKSLLGKTPIEIMNEFRLNKAMSLLKQNEGESYISEIAYKIGFSDPAYFSKKFKEFFGVIPSNVVEKAKNTDESVDL